ncbi:HAD family hydrolase [Paenibacillus sp. N4]|uniref:HAD family hydrolase n=1 Tax=Paenibacillus vietnamensis TaxID=2590547 RepID=UPI001CD17956|nr:HAD family hydrolase [Paenibacillus vietnamensis]MCA0753776.1 HAD family hydrolase [Paenibacillus vietnamensis]
MQYTNVLFDLDGTLTDPKLGITKSVQYALRKFDIHEEHLDKLEPFIGPPLAKSFMERYSFSESEAVSAVEHYREYFKPFGLYENSLYSGMIELLSLLKDQKRRLFVATSKPTVFAAEILKHFDIAGYFERVYGSELDGRLSDKTELIGHLLNEEKLDKQAAVMIGDRKHDIIGAANNGIASIGVGYGYGSEQELTDCNPTYKVNTVKELRQIFLTGM